MKRSLLKLMTVVAVNAATLAPTWAFTSYNSGGRFGIGSSINTDDIQLGLPAYGGNGCPQGTADAVLSPDAKKLSIIFDSFMAEAGSMVGKRIDRKACNLAIPVHVPQGLSVSLVKVDYRGYVSVPRRAQARFTANYFFAGQRGPRLSKVFRNVDDDYLINDSLVLTGEVWSPCGADTILRINSSMLARTNRHGDDVLATVDSADLDAGLEFHLQWRTCR